ncbi:hypothetical protein [Nocardioides sp. MH1]|uniref:hypothetical protein n=1 Tax=Nocardioides sp. MH1 TaxID=3242490 RepID=UPI003521317D
MTTDDTWTDAHGAAVADAAPPVDELDDRQLEASWAQVAGAMGSSTTPRRRRRLVTAGVVTVAAVGVAGSAAAGVLDWHTGHTGQGPVDREDRRLGGPGERIDLSGDDLAQIIVDVTQDVPFPSDRARRISNHTQYVELRTNAPDESASTGAIRGFTADDAICSWANAWAGAVRSGDDDAREAAAAVLMEAGTWPAVSDLDTKLEIRRPHVTVVIDGKRQRVVADDDTRFAYLTLVQDAADGRSIPAMGDALALNVRCIPGLVPDLPQAIPAEMRP